MKIKNEFFDEYVRNFSPTNYANILIATQKLVDSLAHLNKLSNIEVSWEQSTSLSNWAISDVNKNEIKLNLTLIRTVVEFNLDSYSINFISKLKIIAKNYFKGNLRHNLVSDSLIYTINNRPIEPLLLVGNKQALPYNLLLTILHEIQLFVQFNSSDIEYKIMLEQNKFLFATEYSRFKSMCELDATAESLQKFYKYISARQFIDQNLIKNIINLNSFSINNAEKIIDGILNEFSAYKKNYSKQELNKIKNICLKNLQIINKLNKIYK